MNATRMSNVDAAWFRMDSPDNLMLVTAVLWFQKPVDWERLTDVIGTRLIGRYPKFSQRVRRSRRFLSQPVWTHDPDFNVSGHLVRAQLGGPAADRDLADLVSRLLSEPLDMTHSPWQFHLVDGYGRGSALVARVHHCIADGMALASVLLSLTDGAADATAGVRPIPTTGSSVRRPAVALRVEERTRDVRRVLPVDFPGAWRRSRELARAARFGVHVMSTGARVVFATREPRTALRGRLGAAKTAAWSSEFDLDVIKSVAAARKATVNDVLLAVVAGALRRHLVARSGRAHDLHVFVPVNLRPVNEAVPRDLGNRFGLAFIRLPVSEADPATRVGKVHERMNTVKSSAQAAATFAILNIIGALPESARSLAVRILGAKSTAIVTNVAGPRDPVSLAGTTLDGMVFWVPQAGSVGLGVSILSYARSVRVGVAADRNLVPDPRSLVRAVELEWADLAQVTLDA